MNELRFSVLGPLAVRAGGPGFLEAGPHKQRLTLAMLLAHPNKPVTTEAITGAVWASGGPPRSARKNLQVYVSNLRRILEARAGCGDRIIYEDDTYQIRVAPEELDSLLFRDLMRAGRQARAAGALAPAADLFRRALRLWRSAPFTGLHRSPPLAAEAARLDLLRLQVVEDWAENELELGNSVTIADRLTDLAGRYPERERLRAAQMTALFRAGRQTEALGVFDEVRRHLAAGYGLSPTPALEALYHSLLADRRVPALAG